MFRGQVGLSFLQLAGAGKVWPILVNNQKLLNSFETTKCCLNIYQHASMLRHAVVYGLQLVDGAGMSTKDPSWKFSRCSLLALCKLVPIWSLIYILFFSFLFPFSFVCSLLLKWTGWDILPAVLENWNQVVSPPALTSLVPFSTESFTALFPRLTHLKWNEIFILNI